MNQAERLEDIERRLVRIKFGAEDCDGYTSNTEEGIFIETLIGEIPELFDKHKDADMECENIKS